MLTLTLPADSRPVCADPALLPLVDAAFDHTRGRGGGHKATADLWDAACCRCLLAAQCLALAMRSGEHGAWAGTTATARTKHGAPDARASANLRPVA